MIFFYLILLTCAVPNHPWFGSEVGGVTLFKITGACAVLYATLRLATRKSFPPYLSSWPVRIFILLFLIALLSYSFTSGWTGISESPIATYVSLVMLFFVTVTVVDSKQRLRTSLLCLIGGLALASLYTLREWQKGGFGTDRPGYVAGDANFFAAAALLTMPLAYLLLKEKRPMWEKIFCGTCLLATVLASLTAASRGAFIGLAFTYLYLLIRSRRKLALLFCALILVPVVLFAPTSPLRRILHPDYGDISSTATHQALWRAGLGFIAQHPLSGIGLGQFKSETERQQILQDASAVGHNTYIEIGAELGVPTLLLFIAMLISLFFLLERTRRDALIRGDLFLQDVTFGLQAGLVGFAPAAFFFSAEYEKPFWIVVFLSACARRMLDVQTAAETDTPLSEQQSELRGEFDPQRVTN